jgi:hypothetical protein
LKSCNVDIGNIEWYNSVDDVPQKEFDLFISEWSLSEMPENERRKYMTLKSKNFLIAYGAFLELDNGTFFNDLKKSNDSVNWINYENPYIKGSHYMLGNTLEHKS